MKVFNRNQIPLSIIFALSIVANLALIGLVLKPKTNAPVKEQNGIITEVKTEAKIIARSVDEKGYSKTVIERQKDIVGNGDITKLPVSQSVIDSLRLDNLSKDKKLKQADLITATLKAEKLRANKVIDSLLHTYYVYNDDFTTAKFTPDSSGGSFDINYRIALIKQDYTKRKWFLGPKVNYTEILSPDKRITINGLQSLSIASPSASRLGVSIMAGYHYDFANQQFKPTVGLGFSYQLIRF